ncbi:hypothetical protein [uncultured Sunxiuqinia sp.]|uniref:hypothetical protein n=1 Tax=uncultured Sunxiuqinia sp. TaxID=1573825 RepID=UPI0030DD62DD|tara:strand:- start:67305 stop:68222 length:918 start_codon:yes stop_codon:yes gene_type:complete
MIRYQTLLFILLLSWNSLTAQRESTKNFIPYYRGTTDFSTMLFAPGTMGPNALPVPDILNGLVGTDLLFRLSTDHYFRDGGGDSGRSFMLNFRFPVVQNFMAFEVEWNMLEHFHTTNEVRDILQIYKDDPGWTADRGDIILSTYIQVLHGRKFWPDMMLVNALKTTSGSVYDGRATDLPAHWHYVSLGKQIFEHGHFGGRIHGMAGLYIWQTNQTDLEQNEGALWGLDSQLTYKSVDLGVGLSGYNGWKYYGEDRPILLKSRLVLNNNVFNYFMEYQTGLQHYYYSSINVGVNWHPLSPFKLERR